MTLASGRSTIGDCPHLQSRDKLRLCRKILFAPSVTRSRDGAPVPDTAGCAVPNTMFACAKMASIIAGHAANRATCRRSTRVTLKRPGNRSVSAEAYSSLGARRSRRVLPEIELTFAAPNLLPSALFILLLMGAPQPTRGASGRAGERVQRYWQRVTEGANLEQLWKQFRADARQSYALYSREVDWDSLQGKSRVKRFFHGTWAVFHSMLMKLSPARRVLLLAAMALLLYPIPAILLSENLAAEAGFLKLFALGAAFLFILLALELADRVTMKRDLEIAREIQHWLIPEQPPLVANADIAFATRPANTVSGDYYDVLPWPRSGQQLTSDRWLMVVADVAGKSIPAALLMATFQASLHTLIGASETLSDLLTGLNGYACAHSQGGRRFTTAFFAAWQPALRRLTCINAGHNAAFLKRANGNLECVNSTGLPLGITPLIVADGDRSYSEVEFQLEPGDMLVIFTDGLVEAVNAQGAEYTEERLVGVLRWANNIGSRLVLDRLFGDVSAFVGETHQQDDITCLVFQAR